MLNTILEKLYHVLCFIANQVMFSTFVFLRIRELRIMLSNRTISQLPSIQLTIYEGVSFITFLYDATSLDSPLDYLFLQYNNNSQPLSSE